MVYRVLRVGAPLVLALLLVSLWALEWSEVAVLETRSETGELHTTRVWYVVGDGGHILIEAGSPSRRWLEDVKREPTVHFEADDHDGLYRAFVRPNPDGHIDIRRRLREKYGLRDRWLALFYDSSATVAVALVPSEDPDGSGLID